MRLGIVGWPVAHSRSPDLHNAVHRRLGINATYDLLPVAPEGLVATLRGLHALGWTGVNVTVPHKVAAVTVCDVLTAEAELIGAVNTLHFTAREGIVGDNTDARGWLSSLRSATSWTPGGQAVVFGTGGAARAVVVALGRDGAAITVVGRRAEAAAALAALGRSAGAQQADGLDLEEVDAVRQAVLAAALVVNATPLGMHGEQLPEPLLALSRSQVAADLVYTPEVTPFLHEAIRRGATAHGGFGMLVHQAAIAFGRWHGMDPPVEAFWEAARSHRPS